MIKVLAFCAALLAPESTGLDPHGRSLHLKLYTDFNTSYTACITTVKQARKYRVDPFVMVAMMYDTTGMSPRRTERGAALKQMYRSHGCDGQGQFIKSSCSAFMLGAPYLASLLSETGKRNEMTGQRLVSYREAVCRFYSAGQKCKAKYRKKAKLIENIARRYADVYSRTHTSFVWQSPFTPEPTSEELIDLETERNYRDRRHGMANGCSSGDPVLDDLVSQLGYSSHCNMGNYRTMVNRGVSLISALIGPNIRLEANTVTTDAGVVRAEYILFMPYRELKSRLRNTAGLRIEGLSVLSVTETPSRVFVVNMRSRSSQVRLEYYPQNDSTYSVGIHWYQ
jgi:hypothetical protein